MNRCAWLVVGSLLSAIPAKAQTVMRPDPPLDSSRAALRDALVVLRDSLNAIDVAAARLQRDFRQASGPSLLSRARVMREACVGSAHTVAPTRKVVRETKLSQPRQVKLRRDLLGAMDRLSGALTRCELDFAAMSRSDQAETVRGYGNDRAIRVQAVLRKYEIVLQSFLGSMRIKIPPLGVNPRPLAG